MSPKEKYELDKMWPKAEEYIINERPDGMDFDEYKTRQRHMREMLKFRKKFYGFEPVTKTKNGKGKNTSVLRQKSKGSGQKGQVSKGVQQKTFASRKTG
jgi:hypothetical protein